MNKAKKTVTLAIKDVWEIAHFYDKLEPDLKISSAVLEAFSRLFIDTSIGDEMGQIWHQKKGAYNA